MKFLESQILHLPRVNFDYCPVLARFTRIAAHGNDPKPFRFLVSWLSDNRFLGICCKKLVERW